jgi:KDO2-lipid IV(A) lauroyltransferase
VIAGSGALARALREQLVDVVFVHGERAHLAAAGAAWRAGRAVIVRRFAAGEAPEVGRAARATLSRAATAALCTWPEQAAALQAGLPAGAGLAAVGTADVGVEGRRRATARARAARAPLRRVVCVHARAVRVRTASVLRTVAMLAPRHPELRVALVGPRRGRRGAAAARGGRGGEPGGVAPRRRRRARGLLAEADLAWVVADGDDGAFGVLDALAAGVPVVASAAATRRATSPTHRRRARRRRRRARARPPRGRSCWRATPTAQSMGAAGAARVARTHTEVAMLEGFARWRPTARARRPALGVRPRRFLSLALGHARAPPRHSPSPRPVTPAPASPLAPRPAVDAPPPAASEAPPAHRAPTLAHRLEFAALRGAIGGLGALSWSAATASAPGSGARLRAARRPARRRRAAGRRRLPEFGAARVREVARASYESLGAPPSRRRWCRGSVERASSSCSSASRAGICSRRRARADVVRSSSPDTSATGSSAARTSPRAASRSTASCASRRTRSFDRFLTDTRQRMGVEVVWDGHAVRRTPRSLRENRVVGMISDQGALGLASTWVPFFGRPAKTPRGPAVFALRMGVPILFAAALRLPNGRFRLVVEPVPFEQTGDRNRDVEVIVAAYTQSLERWVRAHPEQYFWQHRRWKHQPPDTPPHLREP